MKANVYTESNHRRDVSMDGIDRSASYQGTHGHSSYSSPQIPQYPQQSASPAPVQQPQQYSQQVPPPFTSQNSYTGSGSRYAPPANGTLPRAHEVFRLPENANRLIPDQVREQYQRDEYGHVLFFSAPPVDTLPPVKDGTPLMHSAKYLAAKLRKQIEVKEKRKAAGLEEDPTDSELGKPAVRKVKQDPMKEDPSLLRKISETREQALGLWINQLRNSTDRIYQDIYGEHWEEGKSYEQDKLRAAQRQEKARRVALQSSQRDIDARSSVSLEGSGIFKDDYEPMLG